MTPYSLFKTTRFSRFAGNESGGAAMLFALSLVPLIAVIGAAVDYGALLSRRAKLQTATDFAALAAASAGATAITKGTQDWRVEAENTAKMSFAANLQGPASGTPQIVFEEAGGSVTATVKYSEARDGLFLRLTGSSVIGVTATANIGQATFVPYTDVHIVIDVSAAMGVGETAADQAALAGSSTTMNCALACHTRMVYYAPTNSDTLAASKLLSPAVRTRMDTVRDAALTALTDLKAKGGGRVRVALYKTSNTLMPIFSMSSDLTSAINVVRSIDITGDLYQGGNNISYSLRQLNNYVSVSGSGASATSPRSAVILISSGVQNSNRIVPCSSAPVVDWKCSGAFANSTAGTKDPNWLGNYSPYLQLGLNAIIQPVDPSYCAPIKAKGRMLTLEVKYVVPTVGSGLPDVRFDFIKSITPNITSNMTACATSPTDSISAGDSAMITAAMQRLVDSATLVSANSLRLTK